MRQAQPCTLGIIIWALGLGLIFTATGQGEGILPAGDIAKLIAHDAKYMEADLSKATFTKKGQKRVYMAAFMIALYAQNAKDNAPAMATLRDRAIKAMQAADAGKTDETKALVATLKPDIQADPTAKTTALAMEKLLDLETLMAMFNSEKVGGFGMEKALEDLVEAKTLDAAQLENTVILGQKVALIALVTQAHNPKKGADTAKTKTWAQIAGDMQKEAEALTIAALAQKAGDIGKIAKNLTGTCLKCHDMYR